MGRGNDADPDLELKLVPAPHAEHPGIDVEGQFVRILKRTRNPSSLELLLQAEDDTAPSDASKEFVLRLFPNPRSTRIVLDTIERSHHDLKALNPGPPICHAHYPSCGLPQPCLQQMLYTALLRDDAASADHLAHVSAAYRLSPGGNAATQLMHAPLPPSYPPVHQPATHLCDGLYVLTSTSPSYRRVDPTPCIAEAGHCYTHTTCDSPAAVCTPGLTALPTFVDALQLLSDFRGREVIADQKSTTPHDWHLIVGTGLALAHPPFPASIATLPTRSEEFPSLRLLTPDPNSDASVASSASSASTASDTRAPYDANACDAQQLMLDPGAPASGGYPIPLACVAHRFCELCQAPMPCRHPQLAALVDALREDLVTARFGERLIESSFGHEVSAEPR